MVLPQSFVRWDTEKSGRAGGRRGNVGRIAESLISYVVYDCLSYTRKVLNRYSEFFRYLPRFTCPNEVCSL